MNVFDNIAQACALLIVRAVALALCAMTLNLFTDVGWQFGKAVFLMVN
ncbi:hypothetical protein [Massilia sp. TS11]|nr:hypothetical protein [Massilia sp. TS11]MCG2582745.1 hypothetical protein [Massilia sp. TS11]